MCRGNQRTVTGALIALTAVLTLVLTACGSSYSAPQSSPSTSTTRPLSLVEAAGEGRSSGGRVPNSTAPRLEDPTDAIVPLPEPAPAPVETTAAPTTIVEPDELEEQLPDVGFVQACVAATGSYALMHAMALNGSSGAAEAAETANQIKAVLPPNLHDEIDVVTAAIGAAATDGSFEPKPATKPGYGPANSSLSRFFDGGCQG